MKTIKVYYPTEGAFNCWETAVELELSKLTADERRTCQIVVLPEIMRKKDKTYKSI
jgi:hypothetical protein